MMRKELIIRASIALIVAVFAGQMGLPSYAAETGAPPVRFSRDIRPIFSELCFACHGPDKQSLKGDLRLDQPDGLYSDRGGYQIIVPGKSEESELYQRLITDSKTHRMPPAKAHKQIQSEQIDLIRRWIDEGAKWESHWAFIPIERPAVPNVKNPTWSHNPIDRFVFSRLEREGLAPSPQADKITWLRRVTFDLTGLPPTAEDARAFRDDTSPDAYEKVVDRLLASPHYGEHMCRFWLDAARYGDTHGLHLDNYREMWPYRDWVIRAFNAGMPFNQFTVEQLAGDLLPGATLDQRIASGFNRCHVTTAEGGVIEEEVYVRNVIDRVETTGTVYLGLTLGCAVCHEHKYDPIAQEEFYRLFAFFNSIQGSDLDGNRKDHAPIEKVPSAEQTAALAALDSKIGQLDKTLEGPLPTIDQAQVAWEAEQQNRLAKTPDWIVLDPGKFHSTGGAKLTKLDDRSILAGGPSPAKDVYEVVAKVSAKGLTAIRLEGLTHDSLPGKGAGRSENSNVVVTEFEAEVAPADEPHKFRKVKFARAWADHEQPNGNFKIANAIDGQAETGWATEGYNLKENRTAIFAADEPFGFDNGAIVRIRIRHESMFAQHQFGRVRLAVTNSADLPQFGYRVALNDWHSLGPFHDSRGERAFKHNFGPEGKPIDLKQTFKNNNDTLAWTPRKHWADGRVHYDLPGEICATYLYRTVQSSGAQKASISLGSDDSVKVWVNRKEVHAKHGIRVAGPDQDRIDVQLKAGENEILIKVVNLGGGHGFYFALKAEGAVIPGDVIKSLLVEAGKRSPDQRTILRSYFRNSVSQDSELKAMQDQLASLRKQRTDVYDQIPTTQVMHEMAQPKPAFLLVRGEYDKKGTKVDRKTPSALPPMGKDWPTNRLGLARWLTDPQHPLTARVTVNRIWQQYFGTGIVGTAEDFGSQGSPPSHPELLDWLAAEFIESGWDTKRLHRLIATSTTYRQRSSATSQLLAKDPANRLLARGPRFRLDAEMIRDQALALSGLLVHKIGGPSVKPPQPEGLWEAVGYTSSNTARFVPDSGEKVYRRSVYTFWKRTAPPPQMTTFDAPSREACTVRRERTNTPLQALLTMNEEQFMQSARQIARQCVHVGEPSPHRCLRAMFERLTFRQPSERELQELLAAYNDLQLEYGRNAVAAGQVVGAGEAKRPAGANPAELAAYVMVANMLLNLDEVMTKE
jgi:hypothetical protein